MPQKAKGTTPSSPQLILLGPPRLVLAHDRVCPLERRTAALLALLVLNGPTSRDKAALLVWPESDDKHANNSLRQRMFKLRQLGGRDIIVADKLLVLAPDIAHDLESPTGRLAANPESCDGELLGDLDYSDCSTLDEWVSVARQRWRSEVASALAEIASRLESEGRIAASLHLAERLVARDLTNEHAHRRLMRLHYLRADRAAALAAFERCERVLRDELDVAPDAETLELRRVIESGAIDRARGPGPRPVTILRPPRLVGRSAEWQRLERAWAERRVALVSGEPGIGKSRLLTDFAASKGGLVVRSRPGDGQVSYALLVRVLRAMIERYDVRPATWAARELARLLPELGAPAAGPLEPMRLYRAAEHAIASASTGIALIALDDLQFADAASLELLPALARPEGGAQESGANRWLLAARSAEMPPALLRWRDQQDLDALLHVSLAPLAAAAVEELLVSLALPGLDAGRWAAPLARHTGGNPMFILETLLSLLDHGFDVSAAESGHLPLPEDVGQIIERRLSQISSEALQLARIAALAGQDFTPELAADALKCRVIDLTEPWRQLEAAQLIRDSAFAHDLILEATRRSVPARVAQSLHRSIAGFLETTQAPAARVADHWRAAEEHARAGEQYRIAAEAALRVGQKELECRFWLDAAASFEQASDRAQAFRAYRRGLNAVIAVRPMAEGAALRDKLSALAADDVERADALFAAQYIAFIKHDLGEAKTIGERVIALARAAAAKAVEFEALRIHGANLMQLGDPIQAIGCFEEARNLDIEVEPLDRAQVLSELANCIEAAGRRREAIKLREQAFTLFDQVGHWADRQICLNNQAVALGHLGQFGAALRAALQADDMIDHVSEGHALHAGFTRATVGTLAGQVGEFRLSVTAFARALACFEKAGLAAQYHVTQSLFAAVLIQLGQFARAQRLMDGNCDVPDSHQARREAMRARLLRAMGRGGRSHAWRALELLPELGHPNAGHYLIEFETSRTESAAEALVRCRALEQRALGDEFFGFVLHARVRQVDCLREVDPPAAVRLARDVLQEAVTTQPSDMYLPELWWVAYQALDRGEVTAEALAVLARAVDWINERAQAHVPEEFRDSFLNRNPVNRAVLTTASRRLRPAPSQ